jgi:hypothetical protein
MKQRWQKMSGENPTRDRFDLEQEILECWRVTEDIKLFTEQGADITVLSQYYEQKFQRLWNTFEQLTTERKIT